MKQKIGSLQILLTLLALFKVESALAQTTNFSQMNGLSSIASPENSGTFMSDEDMSLGQNNEIDFEPQREENLLSNEQNVSARVPQNKTSVGNGLPADSLTDTLQQQTKQTLADIKLPNVSGTWVDQLATTVPQAIAAKTQSSDVSGADDTMNNLLADSRSKNKRSNASVFDISGIMLRMNLDQAEKAMMIRGFKRVSQHMEIPNFIKWRNEEACRNNGVVGYERLMNCVVEMSKKNNYQYVETAKYAKYSTKEEVEIKLTSNFTGNKIYRIMYKSMSGKVVGSGAKAAYLRNIKIYDFWKKVNQKYGNPDNKEEVSWGLGMNKPYMKASTGFLVLEDPMLRELDYTRMSREDQRFMNTDLYSF